MYDWLLVKIFFDFPLIRKKSIKDPLLLVCFNKSVFNVFPAKYFNSFKKIENKAIYNISLFGLKTSIGYFFTKQIFEKWVLVNEFSFNDFSLLKTKIINNHEEIRNFVVNNNNEFVLRAWNVFGGGLGSPSENFKLEMKKKLEDLVPTKEFLYNNINSRLLVCSLGSVLDGFCGVVKNTQAHLETEAKSSFEKKVNLVFDKIVGNDKNKKYCLRPDSLDIFIKELDILEKTSVFTDISKYCKEILEMIYGDFYVKNKFDFLSKVRAIKKQIIGSI
jgi:hypothetical protein